MKKISLLLGALVIAVSGFATAITPKQVQADTSYPAEVLVSSAQVRFEAQATGYDEATNKYKYKFSWLMPKGKTYSFKIDGNMYQSKVTQNAVIETPFWFSPDITYTIQIYPYANGKGAMLAQGTFKAPASPKPALTEDEEFELLIKYILTEPKLPNRTVQSKEDVPQIVALGLIGKGDLKYSEIKPYLSKRSIELFDQAPLLVKELDTPDNDSTDITDYSKKNVKVYQGKQYASMKIVLRDNATKQKDSFKAIFIKEDGVWKIDYIQTVKDIFQQIGLLDKKL